MATATTPDRLEMDEASRRVLRARRREDAARALRYPSQSRRDALVSMVMRYGDSCQLQGLTDARPAEKAYHERARDRRFAAVLRLSPR